MPRPEDSGPPANFYDAREAAKYTSSSRIIRVQAEIAARCVELLNFPAEGGKRFVLDVGCGSGLSGAALERAGHAWVGCDVSRDMLRIAARRAARRGDDAADMDDGSEDSSEDGSGGGSGDESSAAGGDSGWRGTQLHIGAADAPNDAAELLEHDMGLGLPFRDGAFDGAVSVSALQWLCYDNDRASSAPRRLNRFFSSLYRCLRAGGRAALQFYPENDAQASLIAAAAQRAGFAGGIVVDFPRSTKARKHYLCLSTERRYRAPEAAGGEQVHGARRRGGSGKKRGRNWVVDKKEHQRGRGKKVRPDSKFTGRKRKDKF